VGEEPAKENFTAGPSDVGRYTSSSFFGHIGDADLGALLAEAGAA
jgi:hypothetical protein